MTRQRRDRDPSGEATGDLAGDLAGDLHRSIAEAYQRAASASELQRGLATVRGTGYDPDGLVCAVVSGAGALVDLRLHPAAQGLGTTKLGEAIVAAARHAQIDARQRGYNLMAIALGDEATAVVESAESPAPARALGWDTVTVARQRQADQPDQAGQRDRDDPDDVFAFDPSIFRSDR